MRWELDRAVTAAAVVLVSVLVGCSSRSPASADPPQQAAENSKAAEKSAGTKSAAASLTASEPPPATADLPSLVAGFQSPHSIRVFETTEQFRKLPADVRRSMLGELSAHEDASVRHNAWRAFATWATREDVPALIAALESPYEDVRVSALDLLARFPNEETLSMLTKVLEDPLRRERAEELLASIGPAAETALLDYASHADAGLRSAAWRILGRVGTRRSLTVLEGVARQSDYQQEPELQAAMEQIRERLRR